MKLPGTAGRYESGVTHAEPHGLIHRSTREPSAHQSGVERPRLSNGKYRIVGPTHRGGQLYVGFPSWACTRTGVATQSRLLCEGPERNGPRMIGVFVLLADRKFRTPRLAGLGEYEEYSRRSMQLTTNHHGCSYARAWAVRYTQLASAWITWSSKPGGGRSRTSTAVSTIRLAWKSRFDRSRRLSGI